MRALAIRIGKFFFRYRNGAFPLVVLLLFAMAAPPTEILGSERLEDIKDLLAIALSLLGLALRATVIGYAYIRRGGRNKEVYAADLVTDGMFALSRNPLYLGNMLICVGMFLMHGNIFVMAVGIGFYTFVYVCIVMAEEAYLREKFGDGYRRYCADVPRWIPRFGRFREATAGMRFDLRKVILKDYPTIATTIFVLAVIESYEYLDRSDFRAHADYFVALGSVMAACVIFIGVVKLIKKNLARSSRA